MSNITGGNPITIDTVGVITTSTKRVQSVTVVSSADASIVVLSDKNGNEVFRFVPSAGTVRTITLPIGPTDWNGITADTLTGITRVFINLCSSKV